MRTWFVASGAHWHIHAQTHGTPHRTCDSDARTFREIPWVGAGTAEVEGDGVGAGVESHSASMTETPEPPATP